MNINDIQRLAERGESEILEFKKTTGERDEAGKTLCAMLNSQGGKVLIGVSPRGRIVGQEVSESTISDLAVVFTKLEPSYQPKITRIPIEGARKVIVLEVEQGRNGPYTYDGRAYIRQGNMTVKMPREEYKRKLLAKSQAVERWESLPATGITIGDLDLDEIARTVEAGINKGRITDPGTREPRELLKGLGLISNDRIIRAAIVLFGREEQMLPNYPQCLLRLARFRGIDKTEYTDNRQYYGSAFNLLVRAGRFLRDHLPIAGRVVPNLFEREDDPLYPPVALREALANALVHRDYTDPGGSVSVAVYDDRAEIVNAGVLPEGLTVEDLYREHESKPRNPTIASVFYLRGIIERWGHGTLRIVELCQQAGHPKPEFEEVASSFGVRFRPSPYMSPSRIGRELTKRQQEILTLVGRKGKTALSQLHEALGRRPAKKTIADDLKFLRQLGLVRCYGRGRGAFWQLSEHN